VISNLFIQIKFTFSEGKPLADATTLGELSLPSVGATLYMKDLGLQIGWETVRNFVFYSDVPVYFHFRYSSANISVLCLFISSYSCDQLSFMESTGRNNKCIGFRSKNRFNPSPILYFSNFQIGIRLLDFSLHETNLRDTLRPSILARYDAVVESIQGNCVFFYIY
jgi:hypothetical protein